MLRMEAGRPAVQLCRAAAILAAVIAFGACVTVLSQNKTARSSEIGHELSQAVLLTSASTLRTKENEKDQKKEKKPLSEAGQLPGLENLLTMEVSEGRDPAAKHPARRVIRYRPVTAAAQSFRSALKIAHHAQQHNVTRLPGDDRPVTVRAVKPAAAQTLKSALKIAHHAQHNASRPPGDEY
jgi:hypothetical protein